MNRDGKISRRSFLAMAAAAAAAARHRAAADAGENAPPEPATPLPGSGGFEPGYLALHKSGELQKRGQALWELMGKCRLCPRQCRVNRIEGRRGFCRAPGADLFIASHHPHFGEEPPLVGRGGSGTIFFCHCALRCVFCINWEISHMGAGQQRAIGELAETMLSLQRMGCANINVVTPTHYSPHILLALDSAAAGGLRLPLVYNTCGWEREDILKTLDGVVDIYLPDFKYWDGEPAARYSPGARSYPATTKKALLEMHRQVGKAVPDADGVIRRGLMIRHLVMPNRTAGSAQIMNWLAGNLPKDTYINIMSQYTPVYRAREFPEIARRITADEYAEVVAAARAAGLTAIETQRPPPAI